VVLIPPVQHVGSNFLGPIELSEETSYGKRTQRTNARFLHGSWHGKKLSRQITYRRRVGPTKSIAPCAMDPWKLQKI